MTTATQKTSYGQLALEYTQKRLPLQVLRSNAGYYIGTADDEGPCSRESCEYWPAQNQAEAALSSGEWTQKESP